MLLSLKMVVWLLTIPLENASCSPETYKFEIHAGEIQGCREEGVSILLCVFCCTWFIDTPMCILLYLVYRYSQVYCVVPGLSILLGVFCCTWCIDTPRCIVWYLVYRYSQVYFVVPKNVILFNNQLGIVLSEISGIGDSSKKARSAETNIRDQHRLLYSVLTEIEPGLTFAEHTCTINKICDIER